MKFEIDNDVIAAAAQCHRDCACLSNPETLCKVIECVGNHAHFIDCAEHKSCHYQMCFGDDMLCACPVRKEIYNRYSL